MNRIRLTQGARRLAGMAVVVSACALAALCASTAANAEFPFDHVLLLDAAPMRPAKRVPSLTIAADGSATIDLWCRSVSGRVELGETAITIVPGELSESPPPMLSVGQCTPERMRADEDMLAELSQVTAWRHENGAIVLAGAKPLRFWPATN